MSPENPREPRNQETGTGVGTDGSLVPTEDTTPDEEHGVGVGTDGSLRHADDDEADSPPR